MEHLKDILIPKRFEMNAAQEHCNPDNFPALDVETTKCLVDQNPPTFETENRRRTDLPLNRIPHEIKDRGTSRKKSLDHKYGQRDSMYKLSSRLEHSLPHLKLGCEICSKTFSSKSNLKRHLRVHSEQQLFSTDHKKSVVDYLPLLSEFLSKSKSTSDVSSFQCSICKETLRNKYNLTRHMKIHRGEKTYECNICNKAFLDKNHLITHKGVHSSEKPFICEICMKGFKFSTGLHRHRRIHTGEKPHECEICKKIFLGKNDLTKHRLVHTNEEPFSCEICNKRFKLASYLKRHRLVHTCENR